MIDALVSLEIVNNVFIYLYFYKNSNFIYFNFLLFIYISFQIDFDQRMLGDNGSKITVDGTDFWIQKQAPFDKKWHSHKFKGPGLRYVLGVNIQLGHIVWTNGPFPCGHWSDIKIARNCLVDLMNDDKMA